MQSFAGLRRALRAQTLLALGGAILLLAPAWAQRIPADANRQLRSPFNDARAERHWPRSRSYDLENVKLELAINWEKKEIAGTATLTLSPIGDGLQRVGVDAAEMTIEGVTLGDGRALEFSQQDNKLDIALDRAYGSGEPITVAIRYRAQPRKGFYFRGPDAANPHVPQQAWTQGESNYNRYWIPLYDFPNDKATSEIIVTLPAGLMAIANGKLLAVRDNHDGSRTFHWQESVPHSTYLISLVAGRFESYEDKAGSVPLAFHVPAGTGRAKTLRSFGDTAAMIQFYTDYSGISYPYEKYDQTTVQDFLWGGMENVSATTLYTDTLHEEAAEPNWTSEGLVAHELAHQWWGDLLTCKDWSHIWLNESFATFFTNLWYEHRYGGDEYDYRRWKDANSYFCEDDGKYRPDCAQNADHYRRPIVWPVYVDQQDLFDSHTYPKGALVLAMLRGLLGDEAFRKGLHVYGQEHARQPVGTEDLREAFTEATGKELGWFFEQWLYSAGHPELNVNYHWDEDTQTAKLSVEQRQERKELTPLFRLPVKVEFLTSSGPQRFQVMVSGERSEFSFPLAERPTRVRFDPDQVVLKRLAFPRTREELIDLLHNDANVQGRLWAAQQLAGPGNDAVGFAALREALLKDPFYGVRAEVASYLGWTKNPAAREALLEGLNDPDARVREKVAKALGEFYGDAQVAAALRGVIAGEEKTYVVAGALASLGKMHAQGAFEDLQAALGRDSHREVIRNAVFSGFAHLKDPRALPLLLEWSGYGRPPRAREGAIEALGDLGRGNEEAFQHLLALLNDPYIWARRAALHALSQLGEARALPQLRAYAANEIERRLQRDAERAIEQIESKQAEPAAP